MLSEPVLVPRSLLRCPRRTDVCDQQLPPLVQLDTGQRGACFHPVPAGEWQRLRLGGAA